MEQQIRELLQKNGLKRNSRSWNDYERGKFLILEIQLSGWEWHDACQIIAEYLGL